MSSAGKILLLLAGTLLLVITGFLVFGLLDMSGNMLEYKSSSSISPPPILSEAEKEMGKFENKKKDTVKDDPKQEQRTPESTSIPVKSVGNTKVTVREYPYKQAMTTYFWVGEGATKENAYIHNNASAWDEEWLAHYGGVDDPECRNAYFPCGFTSRENPFYFALPYSDLYDDGRVKPSARLVPWYDSKNSREGVSILKGRWIEIMYNGRTCYGEWQDVGPFETDDFAYVFGETAAPRNQDGLRAGLDVSPALRDCLALPGSGLTRWRFTEEPAVPEGPWLPGSVQSR